jgi:hypothetical protein
MTLFLDSLPGDTAKLQSHSTMQGQFTPDLGAKKAKGLFHYPTILQNYKALPPDLEV